MRRISEELIEIVRNDIPGPNSLSNTALLYMNRQTYEVFKTIMQAQYPPGVADNFSVSSGMNYLFGIPIMLYHGVPIGRWELVQRVSGENITSGNVWETESGALCGRRWLTYNHGFASDTKDHECIMRGAHQTCVCKCGQAIEQ